MQTKTVLMAGIALAAAASSAQAATTQTSDPPTASAASVTALQQQIRAMEAQIDYMKRQIELIHEQVPPKPAPDSAKASLAGGRPTLTSADGNFKFSISGRSHLDYANYFGLPHGIQLHNGVNERRAYITLDGVFYKDWEAVLEADFGNSGGNENKTTGYLRTAQLTYGGFQNMGMGNLKLDVGYMEPIFSFERGTSSNNTFFLERAAGEQIAAGFGADDRRFSVGGRDYGNNWFADLYYTGQRTGTGNSTGIPANGTVGSLTCTGPVAGGLATVTCPTGSATLNQTRITNSQSGMLGRFAFVPWRDDDSFIHVGINGQYIFTPDEQQLTTASGTTTTTTRTRTIGLAFRPGLTVDSTNFINTNGGANNNAVGGNIPVQDGAVLGGELAGGWRSITAWGQWFRYYLNTDHPVAGDNSSPTVSFDGYNIDLSYVVTGEGRSYDKTTGSYGGVKPANNFDPANDGWGALELVARFDQVNLNDRQGSLLVEGGRQTLYQVGVNWYLNPNIRFMLDYIYGDIRKARITGTGAAAVLAPPTPGAVTLSPHLNAIGVRTQFNF